MTEAKLKHLEFIQNVIARMNTNSFLIKGWAITLIAALFALAAKDSDEGYVLITWVVLPAFWGLDGYFLAVERRFTMLYDAVRACPPESPVDFDMHTESYAKGKGSWVCSVFSVTLGVFYGTAVLATLLVRFLLEAKHG